MSHAMTEGSGGILHLVAPLINMTKAQVVRVGLELNAPYQLTWSCYEGDYKPCGACGTCIDRAAAFAANEVADPALKGI
jgi:7-cyano-7-deazaguanine synthase